MQVNKSYLLMSPLLQVDDFHSYCNFMYKFCAILSSDESIHQKRCRNSTMSDSLGILDEMPLDLADSLTYEQSPFVPENSELHAPQTLNQTGVCW